MRVVLVDSRIPDECESELRRLGFMTISMPPADGLSAPLASHPDMLIAKLGDNIITTADYVDRAPYVFSDIREYAPHIKIHITDERYEPEYPRDAILNVLTLGHRVFLKKDSVSKKVLEIAESLGYEIVNTKQGYPACTVLTLTDNDAVTADRGLALTLREWGVSVTLIENGGIELPPYEYGFIGGAAGTLYNHVYFLGNIERHPESKKITNRIESLGMHAVSLGKCKLLDLGRIIFL